MNCPHKHIGKLDYSRYNYRRWKKLVTKRKLGKSAVFAEFVACYSDKYMERGIAIIKQRKIGILAISVTAIIFYGLFLKPSPPVRVNLERFHVGAKDTALSLSAPEEIDGVGKRFSMKVELDTKGHFINAVQSSIEYDPRVLEVVSTNTEKSFCKFYPENTFDNTKGKINLSCGSPYPGFRGKNTVQTIEFLAKAIKTTEIKIGSDSMVLANDGKGTNLLDSFEQTTVKIKATL